MKKKTKIKVTSFLALITLAVLLGLSSIFVVWLLGVGKGIDPSLEELIITKNLLMVFLGLSLFLCRIRWYIKKLFEKKRWEEYSPKMVWEYYFYSFLKGFGILLMTSLKKR